MENKLEGTREAGMIGQIKINSRLTDEEGKLWKQWRAAASNPSPSALPKLPRLHIFSGVAPKAEISSLSNNFIDEITEGMSNLIIAGRFTKFLELPTELRIIIWELALPLPPTELFIEAIPRPFFTKLSIHFRYEHKYYHDPDCNRFVTPFLPRQRREASVNQCPIRTNIYQVCREAHQIFQETFRFTLNSEQSLTSDSKAPEIVRFGKDTIINIEELYELMMYLESWDVIHVPVAHNFSSIRNLCLPFDMLLAHWPDGNRHVGPKKVAAFLHGFPDLRCIGYSLYTWPEGETLRRAELRELRILCRSMNELARARPTSKRWVQTEDSKQTWDTYFTTLYPRDEGTRYVVYELL
ncbi:hypothetical protein B0O99DRAFT_592927 [Bisporella sp. PMI_857]|nr:hypothetical protein B0O99DRAFT_592927 [Bisporella sp. PMI_857]